MTGLLHRRVDARGDVRQRIALEHVAGVDDDRDTWERRGAASR